MDLLNQPPFLTVARSALNIRLVCSSCESQVACPAAMMMATRLWDSLERWERVLKDDLPDKAHQADLLEHWAMDLELSVRRLFSEKQ